MARISFLAPSNTGVANGTPFGQVASHFDDFGVAERIQVFLPPDWLYSSSKNLRSSLRQLLLQHVADALTNTL